MKGLMRMKTNRIRQDARDALKAFVITAGMMAVVGAAILLTRSVGL